MKLQASRSLSELEAVEAGELNPSNFLSKRTTDEDGYFYYKIPGPHRHSKKKANAINAAQDKFHDLMMSNAVQAMDHHQVATILETSAYKEQTTNAYAEKRNPAKPVLQTKRNSTTSFQ